MREYSIAAIPGDGIGKEVVPEGLRALGKTMFELKIITQFGAAHQLRNYDGKCENLHGHNWKIEVFLKGEELDKDGMLVDFTIIKERTKEIIERFDHRFLNDLECFSEINPSSENIAKYIYGNREY